MGHGTREIQQFLANPESWTYEPDKPKFGDYHQLGKDLGHLLIERGYQWKTYYPHMVEVFELAFPPLRTDSFGHYYEDCRVIRKNLEKVSVMPALDQLGSLGHR